MATTKVESNYDASQIQMLRGLEAVRENMGMYLGGKDAGALHHLVYEVVDNSVDEALAGICDTIIIELREDGSVAVIDNGRGIPTDIHPVEKRSALEIALTELHAGGKFKGSQGYKVSGGLHGVGVSAVNAVSEWLRAEVRRDGQLWLQEYVLGIPQAPVRAIGPAEGTGTTIIFKPDASLFTTVEFNYRTLASRFREMAYLNKSLRFKLIDYIAGREVSYYFDGGIVSFVRHLTREKGPLMPQPFYVEKAVENVNVEIALQYSSDFNENLLAFANNIANPDGGTHVTGFRTALTRTINAYGRNKGLLKEGESLSGDDVREGLTAIISVKLFRPQFESQTKSKLATPEAKTAVETVLNEALSVFLDENPTEARRMIEKALLASRARDAARKARDLVQRKGALEGFALPGKLADCSDKEPAHCEIFIVEGDSAGGCFIGSTPVQLASGVTRTMQELAEDWNNGIQHVGYATTETGAVRLVVLQHPRLTKQNAPLVAVELDYGDVLRCTPDHLFRLADGSYKPAAELTVYDALMGLELARTVDNALYAQTNVRCVRQVVPLRETADVYDLTVDHYHNFALASGVFVHNSAKQGRDRRFQAILPLRGKILNVEKARLDKMLANNEVKALITALGTGIGDTFDLARLRYHRIMVMSVAGDEPTLVMDDFGRTELVNVGDFIDDCIEERRTAERYQVISFDPKTNQARFRPLKAVIRHTHAEPLYHLTTRYNRSIKVTASHSVFVFENGAVKLKKGNEIKAGDLLVASRRLPKPITAPNEIDLLATLYHAGLTDGLYLVGEDVRRVIAWQQPVYAQAYGSSTVVVEREVSAYKRFDGWTADELNHLGREVQIAPQAHADKAFDRYLPVSRDLLWFLGWYTAEGSMSQHQVSLNLGAKDEPFIAELCAVIERLFGETARRYDNPQREGIKLYFHSVAAARLLIAFGLGDVAHRKMMPNLLFSVSDELQLAFLQGYFLGDGTISSGQQISMTTNSRPLKDGLLYLLGQLGILATASEHQPSTKPDAPIQTHHAYWSVTITSKQQLEQLEAIWGRHANAGQLREYIQRPTRQSQLFVPISDDLMGLEVQSAQEIAPVGEFVYDFSVQDDENFVCGTGGLYAHNTDADVDGSHIRTLLLTFFFRHMRELITNGHLYVAQPPLFRVQHGKTYRYVYDEAERDNYIKALPSGTKVSVQRFKGLGEMNPDQLWDTTLDPNNRMILQVTIEDAMEADETFTMLMGDLVPPRKKFIQTHAADVKNLDV